jgi:hypothetical protein
MRFPTVNGKSATAYLAEDGKLRGTYAGKRFEGRWEIRENQLCLDFPTNPTNGCWAVFRNRDGHPSAVQPLRHAGRLHRRRQRQPKRVLSVIRDCVQFS